MSLQARVTTKLHTLRTLAEAGIISPTRPDRLVALAQTLMRWGPTPAAGYTAASIRHPDDTALIDELGTLTFREVHERTNALATEVGEALLNAGLLAEKPSVGQRHVFLNPRRAGDIHRMIETGDAPSGLTLPAAD